MVARLVLCRAPTALPLKIPETIPSPRTRALGTARGWNRCGIRAVWIAEASDERFPTENQMGAYPMGAPQMGAQSLFPCVRCLPQAPPQPVAYLPRRILPLPTRTVRMFNGQVPVDACRPGESSPAKTGAPSSSTGILMRYVMALLFLGPSLYGVFVFFIYTATANRLMSRRTPKPKPVQELPRSDLTALDSLPAVVGVIAVLGLVAVADLRAPVLAFADWCAGRGGSGDEYVSVSTI